jgi:hypothetical protein
VYTPGYYLGPHNLIIQGLTLLSLEDTKSKTALIISTSLPTANIRQAQLLEYKSKQNVLFEIEIIGL